MWPGRSSSTRLIRRRLTLLGFDPLSGSMNRKGGREAALSRYKCHHPPVSVPANKIPQARH
ncbi:hypothetical protein BN126360067 [Stenotrophomonas indicatrix]|nr:hypothetical protein BN126360067 [Stenotrophomonas indicatrix]